MNCLKIKSEVKKLKNQKNKYKNTQEVKYLKKINEERKRINVEINEKLKAIIKSGESLSDYELWVEEKCSIMIDPIYIIDKIVKKLKNEGMSADTVYCIIKKT